ncbi:hypothetical protein BLW98_20960 [Bacillus mycoides]|nr:hypothetical protein BLW98_20960 [Bacillus mycoides]
MKPVRVYFVCKSFNYLHLPFRKKKQSRLKLTLHKLSLIAMGYRQHFGKNHAKQISTEKEPGFTPLGVKRLFFM